MAGKIPKLFFSFLLSWGLWLCLSNYEIEKKSFIVYHCKNTWILLPVPEFRSFMGFLMEDLDLLILIVTQNNKIVCLNRFKGALNNDFIDKGRRYITRNRKTKGLEWVSCGFDHKHNLVLGIYMSTLRSGPIKKWTWYLKYRYTCILESNGQFLPWWDLPGIHVGKQMLPCAGTSSIKLLRHVFSTYYLVNILRLLVP